MNNAKISENPFVDNREWGVPPEFVKEAGAQFDTLDPDASGLLSGAQARGVFQESGLSNKVLARVWTLSDRDKDGKLTVKEVCFVSRARAH